MLVKKNIKIAVLSLFVIFLSVLHLNAEVAILPYKIKNPSKNFPVSIGVEYSKILSVAAIIAKRNIDIVSPRIIETDLLRHKISAQDIISEEKLHTLAGSLGSNYILLGSLSYTKGRYKSESILYSIPDRKIVLKILVKADNIIKLAEKEINEAFIQYDNIIEENHDRGQDLVFLLDLSYNINNDWTSLKKAIPEFASRLIDKKQINTRVYIVPFSDRVYYSRSFFSDNSIPSIRKGMESLKPAGGTDYKNFIKSLRYSIRSIKWRRDSNKIIIIVSNSNLNKARFIEKYAFMAKKRKISIYSMSLGLLSRDDNNALKRITEITDGFNINVSYHQKVFDRNGKAVELYMENGRLFQSLFFNRSWDRGLYDEENSRSVYKKPKKYLDEIFYADQKFNVTPYSMTKLYTRITSKDLINQKELENNIGAVFNKISGSCFKGNRASKIPLGKVLLSDGRISFWSYIRDRELLDFFIEKNKKKYYFHLGVVIKRDIGKTYGLSFMPKVKGLASYYIPDRLKTDLISIIKKRDYYISKGLFYPPVWFVNIKVEKVEKFKDKIDIRNR